MSDNESPAALSTALQKLTVASVPKPTTITTTAAAFGVFPPELWMVIRDILEKKDDRATLAALTRCNSKFKAIMEKHLYMRFITDSDQVMHARSVAGFMRALTNSPRLASFVKIAVVGTVIRDGDLMLGDGMDFSSSVLLRNVPDPALAYPLLLNLSKEKGVDKNSLAMAMMEVLPTLLPNLRGYHMLAGFSSDGSVYPWWLSYVDSYASGFVDNRLHRLTDVTVTQEKPAWHLTTFHLIQEWAQVAPNMRSLGVRIVTQNQSAEDRYVWIKCALQLPESLALRNAVDKLRNFHFQSDHYGEAMDVFHCLWRCRKIKRIDLELRAPAAFIDRRWMHSFNRFLWRMGPYCLEPALDPVIAPPDLGAGVPEWAGVFTLCYHHNLKEVVVNQEILELTSRVREDHYGAKVLVRFLPQSVKAVYLRDIGLKSMSAI